MYTGINPYIFKMGLRVSVGRELSTSSHFDPNKTPVIFSLLTDLQLLEDTKSFSLALLCQIVDENDFTKLKQPELP